MHLCRLWRWLKWFWLDTQSRVKPSFGPLPFLAIKRLTFYLSTLPRVKVVGLADISRYFIQENCTWNIAAVLDHAAVKLLRLFITNWLLLTSRSEWLVRNSSASNIELLWPNIGISLEAKRVKKPLASWVCFSASTKFWLTYNTFSSDPDWWSNCFESFGRFVYNLILVIATQLSYFIEIPSR